MVHAEEQDVGLRIAGANGADESEAGETIPLDGEVDDDDVGSVAAVEPVGGDDIAGGQHRFHAGVLEHAPTPLQHDGMTIDDENRGHREPLAWSGRGYRDGSGEGNGITLRTHVARPFPASLPNSPPSASTRSCMPRSP